MKLKLKNFRCYTEKEFEFGDKGMILLSGQSGCGKTSILSAINFVLFNSGTKVVTNGKTSCSVQLEIQDLKIVRNKRPNRLVLTNISTGEEYEDDSAQEIINQKFGSKFDSTSYVQQNANNTFILMKPIDKLAFLEELAFHDINLQKIKEVCQKNISKQKEELTSIVAQLELSTNVLKEMKNLIKYLFPFNPR